MINNPLNPPLRDIKLDTVVSDFDANKALISGNVIVSGESDEGMSSHVENFSKDSGPGYDWRYPYKGYIEGTLYHFNAEGQCKEEPSISISIASTQVTPSIGTAVTRSDGTEIAGGSITTVNPREEFMLTALRGMLNNIPNPLELSEYKMTVLVSAAFKMAQIMMYKAADFRGTEEDIIDDGISAVPNVRPPQVVEGEDPPVDNRTDDEKVVSINIADVSLTNNIERLLFNIDKSLAQQRKNTSAVKKAISSDDEQSLVQYLNDLLKDETLTLTPAPRSLELEEEDESPAEFESIETSKKGNLNTRLKYIEESLATLNTTLNTALTNINNNLVTLAAKEETRNTLMTTLIDTIRGLRVE